MFRVYVFLRKRLNYKMNYYYDPILGLQYNYLGEYFIIDIEALPQFDISQWREYLQQTGIQIIE